MPENKKSLYTLKNILGVIVIIIAGVSVLGIYSNHKEWLKEMSEINNNTGYGKGIILSIGSYKGKRIAIAYKIDNEVFKANNDWDRNPRDLAAGDSIRIKYSTKHHHYVVTELEFEYVYPKLNRLSIF